MTKKAPTQKIGEKKTGEKKTNYKNVEKCKKNIFFVLFGKFKFSILVRQFVVPLINLWEMTKIGKFSHFSSNVTTHDVTFEMLQYNVT